MDITTTIITVISYILIFLALFCMAKFIFSFLSLQHKIEKSDGIENKNDSENEENNWIYTTGKFTGRKKYVVVRSLKGLIQKKEYYEYEILFYTDNGEKRVWHHFYPLPDPLDDFEGIEVKLKYNPKKSWRFKIVDLYPEESE